jgi:glucose-1-phosphate thymidylyltransferase
MSANSPVAVIPAAGVGSRLDGAVTGSKEVADIGGKPLIAHLLDRLARASVTEAVVVLRKGKEDIPAALAAYGEVDLTYLVIDESPSELHSVIAGVRATEGRVVALGYPDILFEPMDSYSALLHRLDDTNADLVIGLFPTDQPERVDMVALDDRGRPTEVVIKQPDRGLRHSWSIAAWSPGFSSYLTEFAAGQRGPLEPSVGDVVQVAINDGLVVDAVRFEKGSYLDVGTPDDLAEARRLAPNRDALS